VTLQELCLAERIMPRDVHTRWNSTYNMLTFAYQYKDALNKITAMREMKLRQYEIDQEEWDVIRQLQDLLKVKTDLCFCSSSLISYYRFSKMLHFFSPVLALLVLPQSFQ